MYTVVMIRGTKQDNLVRTNTTLAGAEQRVTNLRQLHGVAPSEVVYDASTKTFILNASEYYA